MPGGKIKLAQERLFIDLTPCIPLSLKGEGEEILERGKPLSYLHSPFP